MSVAYPRPRPGYLNDTGKLVREMERLEFRPRREAMAGSILWFHALMANGSIVSTKQLVLPGGKLQVLDS